MWSSICARCAFRAAAEHDLSFYDQFSSGRIVSRITSDTNDFGQLVVIVTDVGSQIVQAVILGVVLFRTDLKLSLMLMAFLPVIFAVAAGFRVLARRVTKRGMKAMADVNAADQGDHQRHLDRQEFPSGGEHLQILRRIKPAILSGQYSARLCALAGLSHAQRAGRHLYCHPDLRGRIERSAGDCHGGRMVSLHHEPRSVLLPGAQSLRVLGADPGGTFGGRTGLCR